MDYRPRSFVLQELVAPTIYDRLGEDAWDLFNENALRALQALRDRFGPIVVNDWHRGGTFRESGLREMNTTTGAVKSAHKRGEAFDCKPTQMLSREMNDYIVTHPDEFRLIRRVENKQYTPSWMHFDVVTHDGKGIKVFNP